MSADRLLEEAKELYERALFEGDTDALSEASRKLDAVEAELAVARGRNVHGHLLAGRAGGEAPASEAADELEQFERAVRLFRQVGDVRGEAESLFWIGCFHQVIRRDDAAAVPILSRSLELARACDDVDTTSDALRHLGIVKHSEGDLAQARQLLTESSRLRREAGNLVGVASNMVGLIYIARAEGDDEEARVLADEARSIARQHGAHALLRHLDDAMGG